MSSTASVATREQWPASKIGARIFALMADYYPLDEEKAGEVERITVSFPKEMAEELELVAELWNEFDKEFDKKREKWLVARVIRRFVSVGLDGFWNQVGGRPQNKEDREKFVRTAIEKLEAKRKKK